MNRIKLITYNNFPYGGAPANFIRYFSMALANEGHEIEVVLPKGNVYGKNIETPNKRKGKIEKVAFRHLCFTKQPQHFFGKLVSNLCASLFPVFYLIYEHFKKPYDVIILYNTHFANVIGLLFLKNVLHKKIILILPEYYEKPKKRISFSFFNWYDFYLGFKYLAKHADAYIVLSHYLKESIQKISGDIRPILVLPNLMDPTNFEAEHINPFIEGIKTIGYAGTPTQKDGVIDLIKSFAIVHKEYPNTHLLIIGDVINGKSEIPKLKQLALEHGLIEHISFTGLVPFSKIPELLNSCQLLSLTRPSGVSAEAGFPTKLGEYFACKKPVLITRVGDIHFYFQDEKHLIIANPNDILDIANGFSKILSNPVLAKNISDNAYEWMDRNLNYKNLSDNISKFIESI